MTFFNARIRMTNRQFSLGFTLMEVMITAAIIGILAAVALPSYEFAMRAARRAEAQGCLMELQNFMERFYTLNSSYRCTQTQAPTCTAADTDPVLPFAEAPKEGVKVYDLTLSFNDDATAYTLTATPKAGTGQEHDGNMELDSTGARRWDKDNDGSYASSEQTWRR